MGKHQSRGAVAWLVWSTLARPAGCVSSRILAPEFDCSRSSLTIDVEDAGALAFSCPTYFEAKTCCQKQDVELVWDKVEDILQFIIRVLNDQAADMGLEEAEDNAAAVSADTESPCAEYHGRLFRTRLENYRMAREAAEKGVNILQGITLQMLCAACFTCSNLLKLDQVEEYGRRALGSLQDRMGAIFIEQMLADKSVDPICEIPVISALSAGLLFPSWGRFSPELVRTSQDLNGTFANWMDRVLSLVLDLPGTLMFQQSLLKLAFYYANRPDSDAFALLHGPLPGSPTPPWKAQADAETLVDLTKVVCPAGPKRLIINVKQVAPVEELKPCRSSFHEFAPSWDLLWVVTAGSHVAALVGDEPLPKDVLWRRFEVRDPDGFAAALCGELPTWTANFSEVQGNCSAVAKHLERLATSSNLEDLRPSSWPRGVRPSRHLRSSAWPPEFISNYIKAHKSFREAMRDDRTPLDESRALVSVCTAMTFCGGHGDRLNGMLGAFAVALLSGRFFFIDSSRPVPLSLVLEPPKGGLDWRLFGTHVALPAGFNFNDNLAAFESDPLRVLEDTSSVLRFVSNQRLTPAALVASKLRAEQLGLSPEPQLHRRLFHLLFQPSPALAQRLAKRDLPAGRLIGIHFRAGDQMPHHWKDPPRHPVTELDEFLDCALALEKSLGWDAKLLLFADTDKVLEQPRVQELTASGKLVPAKSDGLVHLDRSPATLTVRGLLGVWADWWTLAFDVHALVLCHSGFGATALEIGPPRPAALGKGCVRADGSTG